MATLVSRTNGNFTSATTWSVADATSLSNSEVGTQASTTTFTNSSQFTPGAITIDGIGLKVSSRSSLIGTFSVRLVTGGGTAGTTTGTAVAGTTVTLNANDISAIPGSWVFFKFAANVTLTAATAYNLQVQSSTNSAWFMYRDATLANWSRFLRTTTTQAPAATDILLVVGEKTAAATSNNLTVTMDNTSATTFGLTEIGANGILDYGTTASTAYQLRLAGNMIVGGQGLLQIGSSGTPMPTSSSGVLQFVVASNVQFGLVERGEGAITTFGASKIGRAYLNADAAAAATSITTDVSTGWLSGDLIGLASTTRTIAESESKTMSGNATGTTVPIAALGFAHSGTGETKGELINLTRNVKIIGQSITLQTYVLLSANGVNSINNTEFAFLGSTNANQRGLDINTTTGLTVISGCALRNFEVNGSLGLNIANANAANITLSDCVLYRISNQAINTVQTTASTIFILNCWALVNLTANNTLITLNTASGTINGIVAVSSVTGASGISFAPTEVFSTLNVSNLTSHSNGVAGIVLNAFPCSDSSPAIFTTLNTWRNGSRGVQIQNCSNLVIDGVTAFGNATSGLVLLGSVLNSVIMIKNSVFNAGTTLLQPIGIEFNGHSTEIYVQNTTMGTTNNHVTGDISIAAVRTYLKAYFRNCLFSSTVEIANIPNLLPDSFVGSAWHDQVVGASKAWMTSNITTKDTVIFDIAPASLRITPNSTTLKSKTLDKRVIVPSGKTIKLSVKVRRSVAGDGAAYNGALPRLWQRKNPAIGLNSDVLLATATAASLGAFEIISGTTAASTDNGVIDFYVDCDGTTGWTNVDTWSVEVL